MRAGPSARAEEPETERKRRRESNPLHGQQLPHVGHNPRFYLLKRDSRRPGHIDQGSGGSVGPTHASERRRDSRCFMSDLVYGQGNSASTKPRHPSGDSDGACGRRRHAVTRRRAERPARCRSSAHAPGVRRAPPVGSCDRCGANDPTIRCRRLRWSTRRTFVWSISPREPGRTGRTSFASPRR